MRGLQRFIAVLKLLLASLLFVGLVAPEWPAFQDERFRLNSIVNLREFDFLVWWVETIVSKGGAQAAQGHKFLATDTRREAVLAYLDLVTEGRRLRAAINEIYADPAIADPDEASSELQAALVDVRAEMARRQGPVEAVVQEQIAAVLVQEGFRLVDQAWPPVQMHMTQLPWVLIVSPREEIRQIYNIPLVPGMMIPEQERLESAVYEQLDRSALVVPIGGLGFYPSMIVETGSINFLADVVAHEWAHHWLTLHPLGLSYFASPELRTINETVASIVGAEIGARVIERFYPEFVPPELPPTPEVPPTESSPLFDFQAEMAKTRIVVDEMLREGHVAEAEAYMEQRRQVFLANGHNIRKLNQAYFAFYGAYADTPGATGGDPVGPAVLALRTKSGSLRSFLDAVAGVTSFEELQEIVGPPAENGH